MNAAAPQSRGIEPWVDAVNMRRRCRSMRMFESSRLDRAAIAWHASQRTRRSNANRVARRTPSPGENVSSLDEQPARTSPLAPGTMLGGKFEIRGVIDEGGMGLIYDARQIAVDRRVAIKVHHQRMIRSPSARERFRRESLMVAQLQHPHIVAIYDVGVTNDNLGYLVFEHLSGRPLSAESGQALEIRRTLKIAQQLCRALA